VFHRQTIRRLLKPRWVMICKTSIQQKNAFKWNFLVVDFLLYSSSQCLVLLRKGVQWQYNFMTISTLHSKNKHIFSLNFFIFRSDSLYSLLYLILYRTISFTRFWSFFKYIFLCQQSSINTESGRRSKIMLFVSLYLI